MIKNILFRKEFLKLKNSKDIIFTQKKLILLVIIFDLLIYATLRSNSELYVYSKYFVNNQSIITLFISLVSSLSKVFLLLSVVYQVKRLLYFSIVRIGKRKNTIVNLITILLSSLLISTYNLASDYFLINKVYLYFNVFEFLLLVFTSVVYSFFDSESSVDFILISFFLLIRFLGLVLIV